MAASKQSKTQAQTAHACDNHPDRKAVLSTTSDGAHQRIHLCEQCVPEHWR